jgi:small subunit ribosomal protein S4
MGDPKKPKKKYSTPTHPWSKDRIEEEKLLLKEYGMKNKKELWKLESKLKNYKAITKKLVSLDTEQSIKERQQLMSKLQSLGLIKKEADTGEILGLGLKDLMERRLQTLVFRKGLSRSISQARQFVVHGHIFVEDKKITKPNHIITLKEEGLIRFCPDSSLNDELHPERVETKKEIKLRKEKKKEEDESEEIVPEEEIKKTDEEVEGKNE